MSTSDGCNRLTLKVKLKRSKCEGSATGFTLIELLVAITILAVVAVLGWRGLDSIVRARTALTENLDLTRAMQLTFAQMQSDCAQVVATTTRLPTPRLSATQDQLMLVRSVNVEGEPTRLQVVTYRLRNGALSRQESLPTRNLSELATAWQAASGVSEVSEVGGVSEVEKANEALTLQSDVTAFTVRFWQSGGWRLPPSAAEAASQAATVLSTSIQTGNAQTTTEGVTGLEVTLQLRGRSTTMHKIFLLGSL